MVVDPLHPAVSSPSPHTATSVDVLDIMDLLKKGLAYGFIVDIIGTTTGKHPRQFSPKQRRSAVAKPI